MRLNYVEMAGFRSCREKLRIDFGSGLTVVTGRNGVGKSTIMDAVEFVLTGTISKYKVERAKGGGLAEHTWWIGERQAEKNYVEVGFVDNTGQEISIQRSPKAASPGLEDLKRRLFTSVDDDTLTFAKLCQTMILRDEQISELSLDLSERQRFQAVLDAISPDTAPDIASKLDEVVNLAKADLKEGRDAHESVKLRLSAKLEELAELRGSLPNREALEEAQLQRQRAIEELRQLLNAPEIQNENVVAKLASYLSGAEDLRNRLGTQLARSDSDEEADEQANIVELDSQIAKLERDVADFKANREKQSNLIDHLSETSGAYEHLAALIEHGENYGLEDGHCPLCDAARTQDEFNASIEQQKERVGEASRKLAETSFLLVQTNRALEAAERESSELRARRRVLIEKGERRLAEKKRLMEDAQALHLSAFLGDLPGFDQRIELVRRVGSRVRDSEAKLRAIQSASRVASLEEEIAQLRLRSDEIAGSIAAKDSILERAKSLNNLAKAFPKEILEEQFETVMPLLKELYRRLRPHVDWREIEYDFGGKVMASLNFKVGDGRNPQFLFSSGQRRATGLAFLLAVHLSRDWTSLRTLMLDDPVQHIDDYRALNLVEVLAAIRREGRQVIVAVEDPSLADLLARRLRGASADTDVYYEIETGDLGGSKVAKTRQLPPLLDRVLVPAAAS